MDYNNQRSPQTTPPQEAESSALLDRIQIRALAANVTDNEGTNCSETMSTNEEDAAYDSPQVTNNNNNNNSNINALSITRAQTEEAVQQTQFHLPVRDRVSTPRHAILPINNNNNNLCDIQQSDRASGNAFANQNDFLLEDGVITDETPTEPTTTTLSLASGMQAPPSYGTACAQLDVGQLEVASSGSLAGQLQQRQDLLQHYSSFSQKQLLMENLHTTTTNNNNNDNITTNTNPNANGLFDNQARLFAPASSSSGANNVGSNYPIGTFFQPIIFSQQQQQQQLTNKTFKPPTTPLFIGSSQLPKDATNSNGARPQFYSNSLPRIHWLQQAQLQQKLNEIQPQQQAQPSIESHYSRPQTNLRSFKQLDNSRLVLSEQQQQQQQQMDCWPRQEQHNQQTLQATYGGRLNHVMSTNRSMPSKHQLAEAGSNQCYSGSNGPTTSLFNTKQELTITSSGNNNTNIMDQQQMRLNLNSTPSNRNTNSLKFPRSISSITAPIANSHNSSNSNDQQQQQQLRREQLLNSSNWTNQYQDQTSLTMEPMEQHYNKQAKASYVSANNNSSIQNVRALDKVEQISSTNSMRGDDSQRNSRPKQQAHNRKRRRYKSTSGRSVSPDLPLQRRQQQQQEHQQQQNIDNQTMNNISQSQWKTTHQATTPLLTKSVQQPFKASDNNQRRSMSLGHSLAQLGTNNNDNTVRVGDDKENHKPQQINSSVSSQRLKANKHAISAHCWLIDTSDDQSYEASTAAIQSLTVRRNNKQQKNFTPIVEQLQTTTSNNKNSGKCSLASDSSKHLTVAMMKQSQERQERLMKMMNENNTINNVTLKASTLSQQNVVSNLDHQHDLTKNLKTNSLKMEKILNRNDNNLNVSRQHKNRSLQNSSHNIHGLSSQSSSSTTSIFDSIERTPASGTILRLTTLLSMMSNLFKGSQRGDKVVSGAGTVLSGTNNNNNNNIVQNSRESMPAANSISGSLAPYTAASLAISSSSSTSAYATGSSHLSNNGSVVGSRQLRHNELSSVANSRSSNNINFDTNHNKPIALGRLNFNKKKLVINDTNNHLSQLPPAPPSSTSSVYNPGSSLFYSSSGVSVPMSWHAYEYCDDVSATRYQNDTIMNVETQFHNDIKMLSKEEEATIKTTSQIDTSNNNNNSLQRQNMNSFTTNGLLNLSREEEEERDGKEDEEEEDGSFSSQGGAESSVGEGSIDDVETRRRRRRRCDSNRNRNQSNKHKSNKIHSQTILSDHELISACSDLNPTEPHLGGFSNSLPAVFSNPSSLITNAVVRPTQSARRRWWWFSLKNIIQDPCHNCSDSSPSNETTRNDQIEAARYKSLKSSSKSKNCTREKRTNVHYNRNNNNDSQRSTVQNIISLAKIDKNFRCRLLASVVVSCILLALITLWASILKSGSSLSYYSSTNSKFVIDDSDYDLTWLWPATTQLESNQDQNSYNTNKGFKSHQTATLPNNITPNGRAYDTLDLQVKSPLDQMDSSLKDQLMLIEQSEKLNQFQLTMKHLTNIQLANDNFLDLIQISKHLPTNQLPPAGMSLADPSNDEQLLLNNNSNHSINVTHYNNNNSNQTYQMNYGFSRIQLSELDSDLVSLTLLSNLHWPLVKWRHQNQQSLSRFLSFSMWPASYSGSQTLRNLLSILMLIDSTSSSPQLIEQQQNNLHQFVRLNNLLRGASYNIVTCISHISSNLFWSNNDKDRVTNLRLKFCKLLLIKYKRMMLTLSQLNHAHLAKLSNPIQKHSKNLNSSSSNYANGNDDLQLKSSRTLLGFFLDRLSLLDVETLAEATIANEEFKYGFNFKDKSRITQLILMKHDDENIQDYDNRPIQNNNPFSLGSNAQSSSSSLFEFTKLIVGESPMKLNSNFEINKEFQEKFHQLELNDNDGWREQLAQDLLYPWPSYKLPSLIEPISYNLFLHPNLTTRLILGMIKIEFTVNKPTRFIVINCANLNIVDLTLWSRQTAIGISSTTTNDSFDQNNANNNKTSYLNSIQENNSLKQVPLRRILTNTKLEQIYIELENEIKPTTTTTTINQSTIQSKFVNNIENNQLNLGELPQILASRQQQTFSNNNNNNPKENHFIINISFNKTSLMLAKHLSDGYDYNQKNTYQYNSEAGLEFVKYTDYFSQPEAELKTILYTQFEPTNARRVFPCFDEPHLKAKFQLDLVHEHNHQVLFNAAKREKVPYSADGANQMSVFDTTSIPISTYLMSFVVCDNQNIKSITTRVPQLQQRLLSNLVDYNDETNPTMFNENHHQQHHIQIQVMAQFEHLSQAEFASQLVPQLLAFYQNHLQFPYPMEKLDLIAIPKSYSLSSFKPKFMSNQNENQQDISIQTKTMNNQRWQSIDTMENLGLIWFKAPLLLLDTNLISQNLIEQISMIISHQIAHQYFGNIVSIRNWQDLWLYEALCQYLESIALNNVQSDWKLDEQFLVTTIQDILALDQFEPPSERGQQGQTPLDLLSASGGPLANPSEIVGSVSHHHGHNHYASNNHNKELLEKSNTLEGAIGTASNVPISTTSIGSENKNKVLADGDSIAVKLTQNNSNLHLETSSPLLGTLITSSTLASTTNTNNQLDSVQEQELQSGSSLFNDLDVGVGVGKFNNGPNQFLNEQNGQTELFGSENLKKSSAILHMLLFNLLPSLESQAKLLRKCLNVYRYKSMNSEQFWYQFGEQLRQEATLERLSLEWPPQIVFSQTKTFSSGAAINQSNKSSLGSNNIEPIQAEIYGTKFNNGNQNNLKNNYSETSNHEQDHVPSERVVFVQNRNNRINNNNNNNNMDGREKDIHKIRIRSNLDNTNNNERFVVNNLDLVVDSWLNRYGYPLITASAHRDKIQLKQERFSFAWWNTIDSSTIGSPGPINEASSRASAWTTSYSDNMRFNSNQNDASLVVNEENKSNDQLLKNFEQKNSLKKKRFVNAGEGGVGGVGAGQQEVFNHESDIGDNYEENDYDTIWPIPIMFVSRFNPKQARFFWMNKRELEIPFVDHLSPDHVRTTNIQDYRNTNIDMNNINNRKTSFTNYYNNWFKLNVNQSSLVRVNYDERNWEALTELLMKSHYSNHLLSSLDRANLIDDSLTLMRCGKLSVGIAMNLTLYLEVGERDYMPWTSALRHLDQMQSLLNQNPLWHRYVLKLLQPISSVIGWKDDGPHLMKKLRRTLFNVALQYGDEKIVNKAKQEFKGWFKNNRFIVPNLQELVYIAGVRYGDQQEWFYCWQKYQQLIALDNNSNDSTNSQTTTTNTNTNRTSDYLLQQITNGNRNKQQSINNGVQQILPLAALMSTNLNDFNEPNGENEKRQLLTALASTPNTWLLEQFLNYSLDSTKIQPNHLKLVMQTLGKNPVARLYLWRFVRLNWSKLINKFMYNEDDYISSRVNLKQVSEQQQQNSFKALDDENYQVLETMIIESTKHFATKLDYDEVKTFFDEKIKSYSEVFSYPPSIERAIQQSLQVIRSNIYWRDYIEPKLTKWLSNYDS